MRSTICQEEVMDGLFYGVASTIGVLTPECQLSLESARMHLTMDLGLHPINLITVSRVIRYRSVKRLEEDVNAIVKTS